MNELTYIIPEIFLLIPSLLLLLINTKKSFLVLLAVLISLVITYFQNYSYSEVVFNGFIAVSPFIQNLKLLILGLVAVTLVMMGSIKLQSEELPILVAFSTLGMMALVGSHDLLSMYMAIELQTLPLYIMAAIDRKSLKSSEAGVKYFVLGALASGILLYGISMIYGFTGSTNFVDLTKIFRAGDLELGVLVGSILIISALCFKIGAAPFHMWVPDVYEGSPTIVTAFFSIVPKVALVGFFIRMFGYELVNIKFQQVFVVIAILSLVVSALGALKQNNLKRLIAYSSIGHIGYIFVGIASALEVKGVMDIITYTVMYALMNIGFFATIIRIPGDNIKDLSNLYKSNPIMSLCLVLLLLSMAGIPPTAGFFTKIYILSIAVKSGLSWLALLALITSVISAYYYLRIIKIIYFDSTFDSTLASKSITLSGVAIVATGLNLGFFLYVDSWFGYLLSLMDYL